MSLPVIYDPIGDYLIHVRVQSFALAVKFNTSRIFFTLAVLSLTIGLVRYLFRSKNNGKSIYKNEEDKSYRVF